MNTDRVLVTGASGHVAKNLIRKLLKDNFKVYGLSRDWLKTQELSKDFPEAKFEMIDLLDFASVCKLIWEIKPAHVFHLAGESTPGNLRNWQAAFRANVWPAENIFEALEISKLPARVFLASSVKVYDLRGAKGEVAEENLLRYPYDQNYYRGSKIYLEELATAYPSIPTIVLRFSQISGWGRPMARVETDFGRQIVLREESEISKEYPMQIQGDINGIVDMVNVRDLTNVLRLLLDAELDRRAVFNIVSGESHCVWEIIEALKEKAGLDNLAVPGWELRQLEPSPYFFSNKKIKEATGWKPEIPFTETLDEVYQYCRALFKEGRRELFAEYKEDCVRSSKERHG